MNEEVMKILKMVEEGKLSADKAKDFIEALDNDKKADEIISVKLSETDDQDSVTINE